MSVHLEKYSFLLDPKDEDVKVVQNKHNNYVLCTSIGNELVVKKLFLRFGNDSKETLVVLGYQKKADFTEDNFKLKSVLPLTRELFEKYVKYLFWHKLEVLEKEVYERLPEDKKVALEKYVVDVTK